MQKSITRPNKLLKLTETEKLKFGTVKKRTTVVSHKRCHPIGIRKK